jgi:hypothetical protein
VRPDGETVDAMLASLPERIARGVFAPLALAALNTPTDHGSAQVFAHLLDLISRRAGDADFLVPTLDLSELLPDPCARRIEARNGEIRLRSTAQGRGGSRRRRRRPRGRRRRAGVRGDRRGRAAPARARARTRRRRAPGRRRRDRLRRTRCASSRRRRSTSGFRERVRLGARIERLDDSPGQWLFDRSDVLVRARDAATTHALGGLLAVVISASGVHDDLDGKALAGRVHAQLRRLRPSVPMPGVVAGDRRASLDVRVRPGLRRPSSALAPRLHLAGDYFDPSLPATLEASVASGEAAARAVARALQSETGR